MCLTLSLSSTLVQRELISTQKTSHKHDKKDRNHLECPSPGMRVIIMIIINIIMGFRVPFLR